jgi:hypothetical protein
MRKTTEQGRGSWYAPFTLHYKGVQIIRTCTNREEDQKFTLLATEMNRSGPKGEGVDLLTLWQKKTSAIT